MSVAVVVPARNAAAVLPRLLRAIGDARVIVVDNASSDGTAGVARAHGAEVVHEPRPSRARARNAGAEHAQADRIVFVDAECVPKPGWLAALTAALDGAELAAGEVAIETGNPPNAIERFEALWRFDQERHATQDGWAASANLAIRRETFDRLGGFDPAYTKIGEDVDLCLRAKKIGARLAYIPEAVVTHAAERRLGPVLRRGARHGWSSTQHHRRLGTGREDWRHPGPLVRGDWSLRQHGVDPAGTGAAVKAVARAEYAARMAGSLAARIRRVR